MTSIVQALHHALRYSRDVWVHMMFTVVLGGIVGILPFALLLRVSAESVVSNPDVGRHSPALFPRNWSGQEYNAVNYEVYISFWLCKYFWCAVAEFVPIWLALRGGSGSKYRGPSVLTATGIALTAGSNTVKVYLFSIGFPYDEQVDSVVSYLGYALNISINLSQVLWCIPSGARCKALLPTLAVTVLCPALHVIQNAVVTLYLKHREWYLRMLICWALMSCLRPLLVQIVLVTTRHIPSLESSMSQAWLSIYLSTSCGALMQMLQVSADGALGAALVYVALMGSELLRNATLLSGESELGRINRTARSIASQLQERMRRRPERSGPSVAWDVVGIDTSGTPTPARACSVVSAEDAALALATRSVMWELVKACNIMEGSSICWVALLLLMVKINPYEVAGHPFPFGSVLTNASIGLVVEFLSDFVGYFYASLVHGVTIEAYRASTTATAKNRLASLALFLVVLSLSMEAVGHIYEDLCPTRHPGTSELRALSLCAD